MNLKKYAKLLLILGLFAAAPAQGMSYVQYLKSYFVDVATNVDKSTPMQDVWSVFHLHVIRNQAEKAIEVFAKASDDARMHCVFNLGDSKCLSSILDAVQAKRFDTVKVVINGCASLEPVRAQFLTNDLFALNFLELANKYYAYEALYDVHMHCSDSVKPNTNWVFSLKIDAIKNRLFSDTNFAKKAFARALEVAKAEQQFLIFSCASDVVRNECVQMIIDASKRSLTESAKNLMIKVYYANPKYKQIFQEAGFEDVVNPVEPTNKHLNFNVNTAQTMLDTYRNDPALFLIYHEVLYKEKRFATDHYTFVHGQRSQYYFPEKLYTFLWQLRKKRTVQDFFFPHVADLISPEDVALEKVQKNFLLNNYKYDADNRKMLLFMNYALFANAGNSGSNSAQYVLNNVNAAKGTFALPVNEPFKKLGYEHIYNKFKDELEELGQQYNKKCPYGNLLFIAIPKDKIHKYAYLAVTGGKRVAMRIKGIGDTTDIRVIMDTLLNHPEKIGRIPNILVDEYVDVPENNTDILEFCLVMTQTKGGLDPDTGIKIFPILSGDPARLVELQKKEDELFAKIKAAIEAEENAEAQAIAVNRANTIMNHLVLPGKGAQAIAPAKTMARINTILGHIQPQG